MSTEAVLREVKLEILLGQQFLRKKKNTHVIFPPLKHRWRVLPKCRVPYKVQEAMTRTVRLRLKKIKIHHSESGNNKSGGGFQTGNIDRGFTSFGNVLKSSDLRLVP